MRPSKRGKMPMQAGRGGTKRMLFVWRERSIKDSSTPEINLYTVPKPLPIATKKQMSFSQLPGWSVQTKIQFWEAKPLERCVPFASASARVLGKQCPSFADSPECLPVLWTLKCGLERCSAPADLESEPGMRLAVLLWRAWVCGRSWFSHSKSYWFCPHFVFPFSSLWKYASGQTLMSLLAEMTHTLLLPLVHKAIHLHPIDFMIKMASLQALEEAGPLSFSSIVILPPHHSSSPINTRSEENWGLGPSIVLTLNPDYSFSVIFMRV